MKTEKVSEQREEGEQEKREERREEGRQRKEKERSGGGGGSFSTLAALRLERTINSCQRHPASMAQTGHAEGWEAFP